LAHLIIESQRKGTKKKKSRWFNNLQRSMYICTQLQ
jgi:hypothetical protein